MTNKMNNPTQQRSPALRTEALSKNCLLQKTSCLSERSNLLTVAESLTAEYYYVLLYCRLILLILYACRNAQETTEYNAKGQVSRKSNPYLENVETPVYTEYSYHPQEGYVTKIVHPDGGYTIPMYNGFNESTQTYAQDATLIQSQDLIKNAKGQVLTRTVDGKFLNYKYDKAGRLTDILDPENGLTKTVYDNAGRKTSVSDVNSGTTSYTYDAVENIKTQTDAKGVTSTFAYDNVNRPTGVSYSSGEGNTVLAYDEGGQAKYALGRLTGVIDDAGKLELAYDIKGNRIYQKRKIDDLEVIFKRTYDIQNRLASTMYPDGTVVYQKYASTGHFSGITMDTADGASKGYIVGSYTGPVIENGQFKIIRETGNGVKMEIQYDPIKRRPIGLVTKLASGNIENATSYTYDERSNITKIEDTLVNGRTQDFVYDAQNRLTKATGKYGVENYTYGDNGNLTQRGNFTLVYGDANHKHAVTAVTSPSTGTFNYSYDEAGNMISRNGDTHTYNAQNKLIKIDTVGGDKLEYLYESTGNRIRRKMKSSGVTVYSFDGLYEITRSPSQAETHTLYFKGLYGDMFSQMTRTDAQLVADFRRLPRMNTDEHGWRYVLSGISLCSDISGSCFGYYVNTAKYYYLVGVVKGYMVISRVEFKVGLWLGLVVVIYLISQILTKLSLSGSMGINEAFSKNPLLPLRLCASVASISILFTFTQCGLVSNGNKKGQPPWILLANGINSNTASVDEITTTTAPDSNTDTITTTTAPNTGMPSNPNTATGIIGNNPSNGGSRPTTGGSGYNGGGGYTGGSGGSSLVPVTGMYFLHPDHLGSITMITDGYGNVIAGGNNGGKSHISYTPYGSIHRTDSSGPDISRFKFTGQEEDKESGLLYYKARYYDPAIGRFLQADSVVMPESTFGMNRYMYVEGNPVRYNDPSGHVNVSHMFGQIVGHMAGGAQWAGRSVVHTARWMSGGLKGAADQFNKITNQDYAKQSRVNYSHCAVAGPYGYAVRLGAAPLTGLCLLATGIYEFGVRGGYDRIRSGYEGLGGGVGASGGFAQLWSTAFKSEFAGALGAGLGYAAAAITGIGVIMKQGDVRYQKIKDHKAYIKAVGCTYAAQVVSSTNPSLQTMGFIHCLNEYIKDEN